MGFTLGDRVIVKREALRNISTTMQNFVDDDRFSGIGTVVAILSSRDYGVTWIGICFDDSCRSLHNCNGHCPEHRGWYFTPKSIEHYKDSINQSEEAIIMYDNLFK